MLVLLLQAGLFDSLCDHPLVSLVLPVGQHLLSPQVLLLESPESLGFLVIFVCNFLFLNLLVSLVQNFSLLLCVEALEVVWLHSMVSEHRLLSLGVLSHEVMVQGVVHFLGFSLVVILLLFVFTVSLLFG